MTERYLTSRPGKNGSKRYFWQPPRQLAEYGFKTQRLSDDAVAAARQAEFLNIGLDAWRATGEKPSGEIDTVARLIADYKSSFRFREKSAATRKSYNYALRIIRHEMGEQPVRTVTPSQLENIYRSMRRAPAKTMQVARVMRILMEHARRRDLVAVNPAVRPGITYRAGKGELWSREAIAAYVKTADGLGVFDIGTAVCLNEWIGQRPSDISSMRMDAYRDGKLFKRQKKTGAEVTLPVDLVPHLQARLAEQLRRNREANPASLFLLPGVRGIGMSEGAFTAAFNLIRDAAGLPKTLTFRMLRHTAVTRLGEAGVPLQLIAAVTGHTFKTCEQILDRYNIRTMRMAEEAFRMRLAAENLQASEVA